MAKNLTNMKKNVLHIIDTTGPGGAETVFINLVTQLPGNYNPIVVLRGKGWVYDELIKLGVIPLIIDSKGSFNIAYAWSLVKLIKTHNVHLIHGHLMGSNVYGSLVSLITRVPMIATFHGDVDVASGERFLKQKFQLINFGAKSIVCVSQSLIKELGARSELKQSKLSCIYNGVTVPGEVTTRNNKTTPTALRNEYALGEQEILVTSIGNIRPAKGYPYLIGAAAKLVQNNPLYHFFIVGDPKEPLASQLEKQTEDLGIVKNIHFLGFRENVREILQQSDIFLLSSVSEGFSISTIEALSEMIPVIATRSGGPEEIISDGETGVLVETANPDAICSAVKYLTENIEYKEKLVANGRAHVAEKFSIESMISQYTGLYARLLKTY